MGFIEIDNGGPVVLQAESFNNAGGVSHAFTTRFGGVSRGIYSSLNLGVNRGDENSLVYKNYEKICDFLNTRPDRLVFSSQVHEDEIRPVTGTDSKGDIFAKMKYEADGLITNERNLPLVIFIADCIPILLYCPHTHANADLLSHAIGAVHAGWRGTMKNIAGKAVKKMKDLYGSRPDSILAAIGPGISKCCFETGPEVAQAAGELGLDNAEAYIKPVSGKYLIDLKGINRELLIAAGLRPENITVSNECTMCKSDKFWSHRATGGNRGSQAAIIMLN